MSVVIVMMVGMVQAIRDGREAAVVPMARHRSKAGADVFSIRGDALLISAHDLIIFLFTERLRGQRSDFQNPSLVVLLSAVPWTDCLGVYAQTPFFLLFINVVKFILVAGAIYWFCVWFGFDRPVVIVR